MMQIIIKTAGTILIILTSLSNFLKQGGILCRFLIERTPSFSLIKFIKYSPLAIRSIACPPPATNLIFP